MIKEIEDQVVIGNVKITKQEGAFPAGYILRHKKTAKMYVGSAANLYNRIQGHMSELRHGKHGNVYVQELYDMDPEFDLLFRRASDREEAFDIEQTFMDKLKDTGLLVNMVFDARSSMKGYYTSEEHKAQMRENALHYYANEENRKKHLDAARAAIDSPEHKAKMSKTARTLWQSDEYRDKVVNAIATAWQDPDLKKRRGEQSKQQWNDPDYRETMIDKRRNFLKTDAGKKHLAKMLAAAQKPLTINGVRYDSVGDACVALKVSRKTMQRRMKNGHDGWIIVRE